MQETHSHPGQEAEDSEGEKWGRVSQGKRIGEKDKVRRKGRHTITEEDRIGGRDREWRRERERE